MSKEGEIKEQGLCEHETEIVTASNGKHLLIVVVCRKCGQYSDKPARLVISPGRSPLTSDL